MISNKIKNYSNKLINILALIYFMVYLLKSFNVIDISYKVEFILAAILIVIFLFDEIIYFNKEHKIISSIVLILISFFIFKYLKTSITILNKSYDEEFIKSFKVLDVYMYFPFIFLSSYLKRFLINISDYIKSTPKNINIKTRIYTVLLKVKETLINDYLIFCLLVISLVNIISNKLIILNNDLIKDFIMGLIIIGLIILNAIINFETKHKVISTLIIIWLIYTCFSFYKLSLEIINTNYADELSRSIYLQDANLKINGAFIINFIRKPIIKFSDYIKSAYE